MRWAGLGSGAGQHVRPQGYRLPWSHLGAPLSPLLPPSLLPFACPSLRPLSLPIRKLRTAHTCLRTHTKLRYAHTLQVSCKLYVPSRANCESAVKGPPLLSPFTKYNTAPLPRPREMRQCLQTFSLRCHIFQVRTRGRACSSAVLLGSASQWGSAHLLASCTAGSGSALRQRDRRGGRLCRGASVRAQMRRANAPQHACANAPLLACLRA